MSDTTMTAPVRDTRVIALRRFAISISIFNVVGYAFLGFEQPWTWPFIAVATAYGMELLLEVLGAAACWWVWQAFGLSDSSRREVMLRTGQVDRALLPPER